MSILIRAHCVEHVSEVFGRYAGIVLPDRVRGRSADRVHGHEWVVEGVIVQRIPGRAVRLPFGGLMHT